MSLLKELKEFWRYRFRTPTEHKKLIFYAEYEGSYPVYEGVLNELADQPYTYVTSELNDSILKSTDSAHPAFYFKLLLPFFMAFTNCQVIVMTVAGLNKHDLKRSTNNIHYVYMFHASHGCNAAYEFGAFEHYDSVLCVGQHRVAELRKQEELYSFSTKQLVEGGYYRIERIHEGYRQYRENNPRSADEPVVVLFAPTWEDNYVLESYAEPILESLRSAGYEVVIRLHPETPRRYKSWVDAFETKHQGDPGFTLERTIVTDTSLFRADVLITDWSGITPEYAFGTERPALFLAGVPQKVNNDRYQELGIEPIEVAFRETLGRIVPVDEISTISEHIDHVLTHCDDYREQILAMRKQSLFHFGQSSAKGAEHILEVLNNTSTTNPS